MYAKTLVPGARIAAPSLTATTSESEALMPQLRACGWGDFGEPLRQVETARLLISHDRLQLVVAGQVLLDDINPAGPPGWWEAVDGIGGRCVVVVARSEDSTSHGRTADRRCAP